MCPVSTAQHLGASGYSSWYYKSIYACLYTYIYIWKDLTEVFSRNKILIAIFPNCQSPVDLLCILVCRQHVCARLFLDFFYLAAHLLMAHPSSICNSSTQRVPKDGCQTKTIRKCNPRPARQKGHSRKQVEIEDCQNTYKYEYTKFVVAFQWVYISHLLAGIYPTKQYQYHKSFKFI